MDIQELMLSCLERINIKESDNVEWKKEHRKVI